MISTSDRVARAMALSLLMSGILCMFAGGAEAFAHKKYATEPREVCNECHKDMNTAQNHGPLWTTAHRTYALKTDTNCKTCHEQVFCTDCHYGGGIDADLHASTSGPDYLPKSHRSDFRELHPLKSKDDPPSCQRCHDNQRFCADCHARFSKEELMGVSHRKGFSDLEVQAGGVLHRSFSAGQCQQCHPNSLLPKHEWSARHAREARQDLASCQSCHSDGDICMKCHAATDGLKRNPHPKDWAVVAEKMRAASGGKTCDRCHP